MEFRKAIYQDIENIMQIIEHGQEYLKNQGVNQWQNNYPNREVIAKDIEQGYSYLVEMDSTIIATVAISFDGEITYDKIFQGEWLSNDEYCVIHRMAIHKSRRGTGISSYLMSSIEDLCKERNINSIKVDTHRKNEPMQTYLKKNVFKYCGVIYLQSGEERLAYEKVLSKF